MGVQQQPTLVNKPKSTKPISEARKIRKPLMERKRRERINTCLNDLASLLMDAKLVKTEPGKPTKLEKADILELTVKHIKTLKTQEKITDTSEVVKEDKPASSYKEGFAKCMGMVDQTLGKAGKDALRQRLLTHLKGCLQTLDPPSKEPTEPTSGTTATTEEVDSMLSSASETDSDMDSKSEDESDDKGDSKALETTAQEPTTRLTLIPTRLPSGGVAFVIQGGIDPSFLLPQMESKVVKPMASEAVSRPSSPATCDSSTAARPTTPPSPSMCPPAASSSPSNSSTNSVTCSSTTVTATQCPASPTSNQSSTTSISLPSPSPVTRVITTHQTANTTHHPVTATHHPVTSTHHPDTATHHPVTATHHPVTDTHHPVTAAHHPVTAAHHPVTATHHPVTATPPRTTTCASPVTPPEIQCPSTLPFTTTPMYSPSSPSATYCLPAPSYQMVSPPTHIVQLPATSSYPIHNVPTQPQPIPHHPAHPHYTHNPPTPPPSGSPHNIHHFQQYHYPNYQTASSEEEMDTDGLSEDEIDIDVENDVPYDLSMRRIWRYW